MRKGTNHVAKKGHRRGRSSRRPSWTLWAVLAAVAVIVVGVVAAAGREPAGDNGGGLAAAPDFSMTVYQGQSELGGDRVRVAELLTHEKPVVLNFWAGLCPPCRAEMPGFQRVYDEVGDRVLFVGVDIGPYTGLGTNDDAVRLLRNLGITYPAAAATTNPTRLYGILSMPTTVYLTPDGKVLRRHAGFLTEDQLRSDVQDLIDVSS